MAYPLQTSCLPLPRVQWTYPGYTPTSVFTKSHLSLSLKLKPLDAAMATQSLSVMALLISSHSDFTVSILTTCPFDFLPNISSSLAPRQAISLSCYMIRWLPLSSNSSFSFSHYLSSYGKPLLLIALSLFLSLSQTLYISLSSLGQYPKVHPFRLT